MGLILDTSALVALERSFSGSRPLSLDETEVFALPAIVCAEALIGVRLAADASRAARRLVRMEAIRKVTGIEDYADIFFELSGNARLSPLTNLLFHKEEYLAFLEKYGVTYDARYLWE